MPINKWVTNSSTVNKNVCQLKKEKDELLIYQTDKIWALTTQKQAKKLNTLISIIWILENAVMESESVVTWRAVKGSERL